MKRLLCAALACLGAMRAGAGTLERCGGVIDVDHVVGATMEAPRDTPGSAAYVPVTGWVNTAARFDCSQTPLETSGAVVSGYMHGPAITPVDVVFEGKAYKATSLAANNNVIAIYRVKFAVAGRREKVVDVTARGTFEQFTPINGRAEFRTRIFTDVVSIRILARGNLAAGTHVLQAPQAPLLFFIGSDSPPVSASQDILADAAQLWTTGTLVKNAATCAPTVPATVTLDPAKASDFAADGSKIVGEKTIDITLNCPASASGLRVRATMTDANTPGNRGRQLTNKGTAANIHLRLKNPAGGDILFGPDASVAGNPGQFDVATVPATGNGSVRVPLKVGYGNAGGLPGGGTVAGRATITFSYQ